MALTSHEIERRKLALRVATEANQTVAIAPATNATPSLVIAAVGTGTIPAGAKFVVFTIYPNTTGTILGTTITPELSTVEFPFNPGGYAIMSYTITAGKIVITSAR